MKVATESATRVTPASKKTSDSPLAQSRVDARSMLVGGAAHELNNIFSQTLLLAEVLSGSDLDEELRGMLASLQVRVRHGIDVVNRMFEQSHATGPHLRFDARHLVASVHRRSDDVVGSEVRISHRYPEELSDIQTSPQLLLETLLTLCRRTAEELSSGSANGTPLIEVIADLDTDHNGASGVWVGATAPPSLVSRGLIQDDRLTGENESEFVRDFLAAVEELGARPSVRLAGAGPALGMTFSDVMS